MQELEDEDDDPAGGENGNDGGHASEEGLDRGTNAGVLYFASLAGRLGEIVVH